jgi:hypothetical protein
LLLVAKSNCVTSRREFGSKNINESRMYMVNYRRLVSEPEEDDHNEVKHEKREDSADDVGS